MAHVHAIVRGSALLPCDLNTPAPNDTVVLVVWYKDEHTPIYRYVILHCGRPLRYRYLVLVIIRSHCMRRRNWPSIFPSLFECSFCSANCELRWLV